MHVHFVFIGLALDGTAHLCFYYTCIHCASLRLPAQPKQLRVAISFKEMGELLKSGLIVLEEEEEE